MHTSWTGKLNKVAAGVVLASGVFFASSASAYVLGPTTPGKWGSPLFGTGATITYSYMNDGVSCTDESGGCSITSFDTLFNGLGISDATWMAEINNAFASWSSIANLTFVNVADDGAAFNSATTSGDIRLGAHAFDGAFGILAHGYYPPANGTTAAGDIHFDAAECWEAAFDGAGDGCLSIFHVFAHELGHALGLDHTTVPASLMGPFYTEAFAGPQADDIAGAQFIYGPAVVPEPGTLAILSMGLLGLAVSRRRKQ